VAAFDAWVFFLRPEYRGFGLTYEPVSPAGLVLGLGPAAALALLAVKSVPDAPRLSAVRPSLAAWALIALVVALSRPVGFAAQFLVGCGLPLLTLGVIGLTRWPRAVTLLVMGLLSPTAVIALELTLSANPRWFAPTERMAVAAVLRDACAPGDLLMAPPDIGLPVMGLTPCRAFTSHAVEPDHAARLEAMTRFYADQDPASRAAQLDRLAVSHVVLPGDPGPVPVSWLGPTTRFRRVASEGEPTRLSVYRRQ
jgi:hypothetical protein